MGGQTRNPYDPSRNPGGSSGGTGAAVAANFAAAGMGTDTCGSIRIPSAHNNLFGLRGTRGPVEPRRHHPAVADAGHRRAARAIGRPISILMLDATVGFDPADSVTSASEGRIPQHLHGQRRRQLAAATCTSAILTPLLRHGARGRRSRRHRPQGGRGARQPRRSGVGDRARGLRRAAAGHERHQRGVQVQPARLPRELPRPEARAIARRDPDERPVSQRGRRRAPARERGRVARHRDVPRRRWRSARRATRAIADLLAQRNITALAYPTIRRKPAPVGEAQAGSNCQLSATTGLPAISIPAGFTPDGLPVGLELLGPAFSEPTLLRVAYAYERVAAPSASAGQHASLSGSAGLQARLEPAELDPADLKVRTTLTPLPYNSAVQPGSAYEEEPLAAAVYRRDDVSRRRGTGAGTRRTGTGRRSSSKLQLKRTRSKATRKRSRPAWASSASVAPTATAWTPPAFADPTSPRSGHRDAATADCS